jgi:hypothetical protein
MESTPLTARVLTACLNSHSWDQAAVAKLSGVNRAVVSFHVTGSRPIRDDHLSAYCRCLDPDEKTRLVSAWLQDVLRVEDAESILDPGTLTLREEVRAWHPGLTERQRQQLDFWSAKLAKDDELDDVFDIISRKAGWRPN